MEVDDSKVWLVSHINRHLRFHFPIFKVGSWDLSRCPVHKRAIGKVMSIKIHIPYFLLPATENRDEIEVDSSTIGECLGHLTRKFPDLKEQLFDKNGKLSIYLDIWVNGESSYPEELEKPVQNGDSLLILLAMA